MPPPRDPQPPGSGGADPRSTPAASASQPGFQPSQAPPTASGERRRRVPFFGKGKQRAQAAAAEALQKAERDRLRERLALRHAYRNAGGDPEGRGGDFQRWAESQAAAEARARGEDPRPEAGDQVPPTGWPPAAAPHGGPAAAYPAYPGYPAPPAGWVPQAVWGASAPQGSYGAPTGVPPAYDPNQAPPPPPSPPPGQGGWGAPPPPAPPGYGHGAPAPQPADQRAGFGPPLGRPCEIELGADARGVVIQGTLEQVTSDWITVRDHFATLHWVARSQVIEIRLR